MPELKHSMEQAEGIQRAFEQRFGKNEGLVGVGIGLNRSRDDLALNVFVAQQEQAGALPKNFHGLDVVVDVVGGFNAL